MGAPHNCLLKGGPLPRYMKDTGMFDAISIVSLSSIDTFQANLVWYRYIFQNYVYLLFYSSRIRATNKKPTISLIASMRFFYHRYLILVRCNSVSMLVLLLMLPVLPTQRDPKVKEEGLVPSGRIRARGMMGSKEEGKLDRMMRKSSNRVTLK